MARYFVRSERITRGESQDSLLERSFIEAEDYHAAMTMVEKSLTETVLDEYPELNYFNLSRLHGIRSNSYDLDFINKMFKYECILFSDIVTGYRAEDVTRKDALWILNNMFKGE